MIDRFLLWPGNIDPGAIAASVGIMIVGRVVCETRSGDIIYGKGHAASSSSNVTFTNCTTAVAVSGARR
jgi:hypothetical protein